MGLPKKGVVFLRGVDIQMHTIGKDKNLQVGMDASEGSRKPVGNNYRNNI